MNTFEEVSKSEFYNEDDSGKHKLAFAYFGAAIYHGQCLEATFQNMLFTDLIFKKKLKTNKEVNEVIDEIENSKKTMGKLIIAVKENYELSEQLTSNLEKILDERNNLAHKYFKLNIQKFYSEIGLLEMIKFFCDFTDKAQLINVELVQHYENYRLKLGLSEETIAELMNEIMLEESNRAI